MVKHVDSAKLQPRPVGTAAARPRHGRGDRTGRGHGRRAVAAPGRTAPRVGRPGEPAGGRPPRRRGGPQGRTHRPLCDLHRRGPLRGRGVRAPVLPGRPRQRDRLPPDVERPPRLGEETLVSTLHKTGRLVALSFGGPQGAELAATCSGPARLLRAYRSVLKAYRPESIDFEVTDSADPATDHPASGRDPAPPGGGPAGRPGAAGDDDPARDEGGPVPGRPRDAEGDRAAGRGDRPRERPGPLHPGQRDNLRALADAAHATNRQLTRLLNRPAWPHLGLTPVLAGPDDLTVADAKTLVAFQTKNSLGELSIRGAIPAEEVSQILTAPRQWIG